MRSDGEVIASERGVRPIADLYQSDPKVYPRLVSGRFQRLRSALRWILVGGFVLVPWLQWGERQAVLFDLPERQFHVFGLTFWPQDFMLLAWLLIIAAFALFAFTNWLGRVWCGYACPQSVWFTMFIWLEAKIEGNFRQRRRLDESAPSWCKVRLKTVKYASWLALAFATGVTAVGYFVPVRELLGEVVALEVGGWALFWLGFFTVATFVNGAVLREQVCFYMCPYARFQSAMFDRDTLIVSYDANRGEPRGSRRRGVDHRALGLGDCIACELCVQVCPVGIDIRDGLQYECISCAACIDACDGVMDRMGYPRGLVRYTTENALEGRPTRILRPRLLGYGAVLLAMVAALTAVTVTRVPLELDVLRDRRALYSQVEIAGEPAIENSYRLRVMNMTQRAQRLELAASGLPALRWIGERELEIGGGEVRTVAVRLRAPSTRVPPGVTTIHFEVRSPERERLATREESRFFAPDGGARG